MFIFVYATIYLEELEELERDELVFFEKLFLFDVSRMLNFWINIHIVMFHARRVNRSGLRLQSFEHRVNLTFC